ncbi:MAG: chromosome segregation protein SMC [Candidatus Bathyarchaeia archaeon]
MELQGFKTFRKRLALSFDRGFTVVTGPNGSGKSNLIDAVRFVLGEASPRVLRAEKFSDVISDGLGDEGRGQAVVRMQLDNSLREIPVDADLVTVSRTVRPDGESVYRLNGKRVSRAAIVDLLGAAGLKSSGINIVMQGTVTQLSDLAPEERRRIIEDLVGIAQYDLKKAQAREELARAETNLRVAEARIDEVRLRLENLERERNDALKANLLKEQIAYLKAVILSSEIAQNVRETEALLKDLELRRREADELTRFRNELSQSRSKVEEAWRSFDEEVVAKGGGKLVEVQTVLGDLNAKIARLESQLESNQLSVKGLAKLREERAAHIASLREALRQASQSLAKLIRAREKASAVLQEKSRLHASAAEKVKGLSESLEARSSRLEELDEKIAELRTATARLDAEVKGGEARLNILNRNLEVSRARRKSLTEILDDLKKHMDQLQTMEVTEKSNLIRVDETLKRDEEQRALLEAEITSAQGIAEKARRTVDEFKIQLQFAESFAAEDRALAKIEEMGKAGAIEGVYGRVKDLVTFRRSLANALEAASAGWMKALVVEDLAAARRCVESLKRTQLGRIKIIPVRELRSVKAVRRPSRSGVVGVASSFVRCKASIRPVVNFVFGDTVVAENHEVALELSREGFRAITMDGDLYEAEGVIESGFYRRPMDIAQLIPSDEHVSNLNAAVAKLEDILRERERDIKLAEDTLEKHREERRLKITTLDRFQHELAEVARSVERVQKNLEELDARIGEMTEEQEREQADLAKALEEKAALEKMLEAAQSEASSLRRLIRPSTLRNAEARLGELLQEMGLAQQELARVESDIASLNANIESTLKPELEKAEIDLRSVQSQIAYFTAEMEKANSSLASLRSQLAEMEKTKDILSQSLVSVKDEARKFQEELAAIDAKMRELDARFLPLSEQLRKVEVEIQAKLSRRSFLEEDLKRLGWERPLSVEGTQTGEAKERLTRLAAELAKLGSTNQLAIEQYSQQKDNYKQLSSRLNLLENEKLAILAFMDEVEREKRKAFLDIYAKVNEQFRFFFAKLTGGGVGRLQLQNEDDPFAGGVDLLAEFPGKGQRLISSASGGERSVAALAFLFAISHMQPAPFYLLDEVDAHLDPVNVERLAELIKEFSAGRQFIVISLKDAVVDRAEKVYGVYVEDGVSGIVSPVLPSRGGVSA